MTGWTAAFTATVEVRSYALTSWGAVKQHKRHQNLGQNYPNPFNSETWIPFRLASVANATISIHDLKGKLVKQLKLGWLPAGNYFDRRSAAYWNGLNKDAEPISSGAYFYTIEAGNFVATRKMVVVR